VKKKQRKQKRESRLSVRDRDILEFAERYRICTVDLVAKGVFTEVTSRKNVSRVLHRLRQRGCLSKESWDKGFSYYRVTSRGCLAIHAPARSPRTLSEQSLPTVLATAFYCVRHGEERLTCREFASLYPNLWTSSQRSSNYVIAGTEDDLHLEMLLVDRGGAPRRIRSRVRRAIAQRLSVPDFAALMEIGRFRLNVLTATERQKDKILVQVAKDSFEPVDVVSTVVPELAEMLLLRK